jgi:hypothetical protein
MPSALRAHVLVFFPMLPVSDFSHYPFTQYELPELRQL